MPSAHQRCFKKHGVRFEEAATSLLDPQALAQDDVGTRKEADDHA
jgi:uncharacterized DUF497 family protein